MRRSRKPLNLYGFREFESHPHRHIRGVCTPEMEAYLRSTRTQNQHGLPVVFKVAEAVRLSSNVSILL